ncbi:MAG: low molecular weight phosphatase family protein [Bryobacterales bacterium]|nr:low molecular weight phosphatase family protein [Bryobacterales bacterium]
MRFSSLPPRRAAARTEDSAVGGPTPAGRARVLFVCYGNACRSQMAEGFARAYHADVIDAESAGVSPLGFVPDETTASMLERDVSLKGHLSKGMDAFELRSFDVIVNMSGLPFPSSLSRAVTILEWNVDDPYLGNQRRYRKVRDDVEKRVAKLADSLRADGAV